MRVLYIEDEPILAEMMPQFFERLGHTCLVCMNLGSAKAFLNDHREEIDALMTDYNLPDGNSGALVHALLDKDPFFPVIVVSGNPYDAHLDFGDHVTVLTKPFRSSDAIQMLTEAYERKQQARQEALSHQGALRGDAQGPDRPGDGATKGEVPALRK